MGCFGVRARALSTPLLPLQLLLLRQQQLQGSRARALTEAAAAAVAAVAAAAAAGHVCRHFVFLDLCVEDCEIYGVGNVSLGGESIRAYDKTCDCKISMKPVPSWAE